MAKWIQFIPRNRKDNQKTYRWAVQTSDPSAQVYLGEVRWFSAWRKYCFFPDDGTVFEQDCLRDIANFCETETTQHNEQLKKERQNAQSSTTINNSQTASEDRSS